MLKILAEFERDAIMENENVKNIMDEITAGLTGDQNHDMKYLKEQMEKYQDHEAGDQIVAECSRLLLGLAPDEVKEEFAQLMLAENQKFDDKIKEVQLNILKRNYGAALETMETMIEKYQKFEPLEENNDKYEFIDFGKNFEEDLYKSLYQPDKKVMKLPFKFAELYYQYGMLLFDLERYEEAQKVLEKAIKWNPVNAVIAFEYAETFKALNKIILCRNSKNLPTCFSPR